MSGLEFFFDVENKIVFVFVGFIVLSGIGFVVNFLFNCIFFFVVLGGVVIGVSLFVGMVVLMVIVLDIFCDYDIFCSDVFDVCKNVFIKKEIEKI